MYPPYQQLEATLTRVGAIISVAEVHGILCGLYCASSAMDEATWLPHLFDDVQPEVANDADFGRLLDQLMRETAVQMDDENLGFQPVLPEDGDTLALRTAEIAKWCQGLLLGLGLGGLPAAKQLPENCREFIGDVVKISRVEAGTESDEESGERALCELFEYLRVGLMLLHEALTRPNPDHSPEVLH